MSINKRKEPLFLRKLIRDKEKGLIGLDIGSDSLKLLKINSSESPFKIENFSISSLPANTNKEKDYSIIADTLKKMMKESGVSVSSVALAIPRSSAIIKNITIDSRLTEDEIESRAWIEANRHFPDLVGNIHLDFSILGPSVQDSTQIELILVACRKDQIKPYLEILQLAGLTPKIVDVNSYALERALNVVATMTTPPIKTIAMLNLDFTLSTLIVMQEGKLTYAHDQSYDGHRLMNQAKTVEPNNPKYMDILKETLSAHLRHSIHIFFSSRPNVSVEKIILSGDCSTLPELATFVQHEIGIDTVIADPFANMTMDSRINAEEFQKHKSSLMLCLGLALSTVT